MHPPSNVADVKQLELLDLRLPPPGFPDMNRPPPGVPDLRGQLPAGALSRLRVRFAKTGDAGREDLWQSHYGGTNWELLAWLAFESIPALSTVVFDIADCPLSVWHRSQCADEPACPSIFPATFPATMPAATVELPWWMRLALWLLQPSARRST